MMRMRLDLAATAFATAVGFMVDAELPDKMVAPS